MNVNLNVDRSVHAEIAITLWKISKIAATKCHIVRMH